MGTKEGLAWLAEEYEKGEAVCKTCFGTGY